MGPASTLWTLVFGFGIYTHLQWQPLNAYEDNQGTIAMSLNPIAHASTKHIDISYH